MHIKQTINSNFNKLKEQLVNIKTEFTSSDETIHKARNQLKIITMDNYKFVVKSFKIPHIINKIAYTFFRDSKAKKSYLNAVKLQELNINTPTPVALIEHYKFGLLNESYYISILEDYDFTIREVFHHKVDDYEEILKQFTAFTYELHQKGVWHVDYSLGNILITKKEDSYLFSLVDINRMEFKNISAEEGLKNFNKFWAKDEKDLVTIADKYSELTNFDKEKALEIIKEEAKKIQEYKNSKKRLKKVVGIK